MHAHTTDIDGRLVKQLPVDRALESACEGSGTAQLQALSRERPDIDDERDSACMPLFAFTLPLLHISKDVFPDTGKPVGSYSVREGGQAQRTEFGAQLRAGLHER